MKADLMATGLQQRISTRLAFLATGMAMSAWAPLVPFAQARTGVQQGELGLLLLCLGIGSLLAMPVMGVLAARFGCRRIILASGLGCCLVFPVLAIAPTAWSLALALFLFGATIGTLDVAMNIQAVIVEKEYDGALMSGFHGLFSVGGIVGAGGMTRGAVVLIGALCSLVFLAEGAVLDWSAVMLTSGGFTAGQDMPASLAISAITTIGYAGILAGPGLIGFVAHAFGLQLAFAGLACGMLLVAASGWSAVPGAGGGVRR